MSECMSEGGDCGKKVILGVGCWMGEAESRAHRAKVNDEELTGVRCQVSAPQLAGKQPV